MSVAAMTWAWAMIAGERVGRSPSSKLVLMRLADRADPAGKCWPGHETTAVDLDVSPSTAAVAIRDLERRELLRIEPQRDADGRDRHNIYHLRLDMEPPAFPAHKVKQYRDRRRGRSKQGVPDSGTPVPESVPRGTGIRSRNQKQQTKPKQQQAAADACDGPLVALAQSAAAASAITRRPHQAPRRPYHGCRVHACTDDRERVDACVADVGDERVEAVAADLRTRLHRLPFPSEIEDALAAEAAAQHEASAAAQRTDRARRDAAADAAASERLLALYSNPNPAAGQGAQS